MKILFTILFLSTFQSLFAQKAIEDSTVVSTTEEEYEYNYITKGYKVQVIEQGGDLKRGYELMPVARDILKSNFTFAFFLFKRTASQEYCAVMVTVKVKSSFSEKIHYLCIPVNNEILEKKYSISLTDVDYSFQQEYARLMSLAYSDLLILNATRGKK